MEPSTLLEHWQRNKARPTWVKNHRGALMEYLSVDDPIPTSSNHAVQQWVNRYTSTVSRQLKEAAGTDSDDDPEQEAAVVGGDA